MAPKKGCGTKREAKTDKEEEEQPPQKKTKEENEQEEQLQEEQPPQDGGGGRREKTTAKEKQQTVDESKGAKVLEKGHIYFLYRPKASSRNIRAHTV